MSVEASQVAVVTGASRGIGVSIVQEFARAGYGVYAVARDVEATKRALAPEIARRRVAPVALDVTRSGDVERFFAEEFGGGREIAVLFNNAGRFESLAPVWEADVDEWWGDVTVNLRGTFIVTRWALPVMMRADRGIIINMDGGRPVSGSGYAASKAAVAELTRILDKELRAIGSNVLV
jgi:3-oxoacyl-[acyl-carrier protein] reductase